MSDSDLIWRRADRLRAEHEAMAETVRRNFDHGFLWMLRPSSWRALRELERHADLVDDAIAKACRHHGSRP